MEQLIKEIATVVQDYQNNSLSDTRITKWIEQFEEPDRLFVLTELKYILEQRYISKEKAYIFLKEKIQILQLKFNYESIGAFLKDSYFLNILDAGKSQNQLLLLMQNVVKQEFGINFELNIDYSQQKNIIYLDDILHTGNQVYHSITGNDKMFLQLSKLVIQKDKRLIFLHYFSHKAQEEKIKKRFDYFNKAQDDKPLDNFKIYWEVKEYILRLKPLNENQPANIVAYEQQIENLVRSEAYEVKKSFYRTSNEKDNVFSSEANQIRFENIILQKGLEIRKNTYEAEPKMRPLGFSLPSYKDFGFGSLCFTWLNVPNNTPLAFWGTGGGFCPLFPKK